MDVPCKLLCICHLCFVYCFQMSTVLPYIADGLEFGCRMLTVLLMACCVISQCLHPYFVCYSILVNQWEFLWILAFLSHVACMCTHLLLISNAAYSTYVLDDDRLRHVQFGSCAVACICLAGLLVGSSVCNWSCCQLLGIWVMGYNFCTVVR
jgi:hypothetical protein